ncbi:protein PSK SIMULATOR 1-like [Dioscorea cayenensis subsp. rotundata]|uniref:Protein PSK SIMULATOR 1-like n=1 Tax=Dioscorea cayennensis subsp. rotundata TaxID=55577 RepID=A0AB40C730_DIOCR|nr:protein PSK SIMULATOR 1-like [Dioscorea cayenensis subsp. rotundata]
MGCACSRAKVDEKTEQLICDSDSCSFVAAKKEDRWNYSGEIAVTPARAGASKASETSSFFGRASLAGLEKAMEVIDTLGSSMSNLNAGNGFISGTTARENKISILAFEVANTIVKGANLLRSLSEENIQFLKDEVFQSDGVRQLISADTVELLVLTSTDKREELDVFSREVIRFGDLCKDPTWHNLGRYFQRLDSDFSHRPCKEEVETTMQQLMDLAQTTSELYHELHALDRFEQDHQRRLHEEKLLPAARRESLMILQSELKHQRKLVRSLKKKSLWSRSLEEVVEKLVEIVIFVHKEIDEVFGTNSVTAAPNHTGRLGTSGLALHYANIINQIDSIVCRPFSLPANMRETLYRGLPADVKIALRSRLHPFDANEKNTGAQIKAELQKTLKWIVPIADNTVRIHQGFGWVGEWANISTEVNKKPSPQHNIARIQTLFHADKRKTEEVILELIVWLHRLIIQVKNKGYGMEILNSGNAQSNKVTSLQQETKKDAFGVDNVNHISNTIQLSKEEVEMLEGASSTRTVLGRSKSLQVSSVSRSETRTRRRHCFSRSCDSSPARESCMASNLHFELKNVLDVMDGLDTL